ncbi:hypothetical protein A2881_05800 [Candidatus Peribacteria bacterium RIFCSPHIGHO2_01_FULL_55_13]|nr:MAG: hypothetical protein A2881_05800 [Candidatus Peribacteria bacterium RIFCSPHIGHO2_01_FULL_55_13]OGJ64319.1 MAG: hypothetical protein A3F36_03715 [Candidatus Peribacteria bacterium RIFCSPHIGHO2_12_FULL_55_11]
MASIGEAANDARRCVETHLWCVCDIKKDGPQVRLYGCIFTTIEVHLWLPQALLGYSQTNTKMI